MLRKSLITMSALMLAGCTEVVSTMDLLSWNDVTSATDEANGIQTYWKREQANQFTEIVWLTTVPKNSTKDLATLYAPNKWIYGQDRWMLKNAKSSVYRFGFICEEEWGVLESWRSTSDRMMLGSVVELLDKFIVEHKNQLLFKGKTMEFTNGKLDSKWIKAQRATPEQVQWVENAYKLACKKP